MVWVFVFISGFWFFVCVPPPNIPVSFWVFAVEQLCERASSLCDKESEGMLNSADRNFKLHLQWPSLLEDRGKKACWVGLSDHWTGIWNVSQNCLSKSEGKTILGYAREGLFPENLVCSLRRHGLKKLPTTHRGSRCLVVLVQLSVGLCCGSSATCLAQLGSGELEQWRRGFSWAELWADAKLHSYGFTGNLKGLLCVMLYRRCNPILFSLNVDASF